MGDPFTPKTAKEWLEEADHETLQAFQHVLVAAVGPPPMGLAERACFWGEFNDALARFGEYARLRHAAKHAAIRAAMYELPKSVTIYRDATPGQREDP